mmetsp:Transcript_7474/g.9957  ORF Transcript_7474/g.9957 Transcript_7474/m.9957 type:complete len:159 (-) Transcript_7474:82-558(-)|eukprot:CAMPEP_0117744222 /NCGR_PEP_ID=MMETSP0947-20121206/6624_1 /TAXON_ID=44440 /ORGANISM="Chattonella subsalsa, Strain CCMP2191" /LENGTH=158 /DNA_ID=CAMNT_0005561117 /DNA_START=103 /DNA_END=579 /DNA_ORIENTATION=-
MEGKYEEEKGKTTSYESKGGKDVDSDDEMINMNDGDQIPSTSRVGGLELDLTTADGKSNDDDYVEENKVERRQHTPVMIIFELPDGSTGEKEFKLGQTVELLKSFVEGEFDIPMTSQKLLLNGTQMMDPLCLLDYPDIDPSGEVFITVEGELGEESKK